MAIGGGERWIKDLQREANSLSRRPEELSIRCPPRHVGGMSRHRMEEEEKEEEEEEEEEEERRYLLSKCTRSCHIKSSP